MLWHVRSWFWEDCFPQRYLVLKDSKQLLLLTHQSTQSVHLTISFSNSHTSSQYSPCTNSPQGQVLTIRDLPPRACSNYSNQPILSLLRTPTCLTHSLPPKSQQSLWPMLCLSLSPPPEELWSFPPWPCICMWCLLLLGTCEYRPILKENNSFSFHFLFVTI